MMKCLCCGKRIDDSAKPEEKKNLWHSACIRKFFKTSSMPELSVNKEELEKLAERTINQGLTVPGVQKKLSLHLSGTAGEARLTLVDYPTGFILKPQSKDFEKLPEAEDLVMRMAELVGIKTVPHGLIMMNDELAYITRRIDRNKTTLYAMEDFCQLSERSTQDKYKGSYDNCVNVINKYSKNTGLDIAELFLRLVFCFITGNSDMHLKNFSLIERKPANRVFSLSPAYDMLPVNIVMPEDRDETALTLNGKKRNLTQNDFLKFADKAGITKVAAISMIKHLVSKEDKLLDMVEQSYLSEEQKASLSALLSARCARFKVV